MEHYEMKPEAVRAKEEYLFTAGRDVQKAIDEVEKPTLMEDKYGRQYFCAAGEYEEIPEKLPDKLVKAEPFETFSLDGLLDYLMHDPEGKFGIKHIVRVKSPTLVEVITTETGYWRERELVAYCKAVIPEIRFGVYMDADDFQVMVQTGFVDSENRAKVLKLAGNVRKEQNMQTADDGVSQKITINSGVSTATDVIVKNPVELTPYRTFHEVEQPESAFVLRFDEDGNPALFTGDGSKWKLEAVASISKYIKEALKGSNANVIVIA